MIEKAKNKIIDEMEKNKEDESIQYIGKYLLKQIEINKDAAKGILIEGKSITKAIEEMGKEAKKKVKKKTGCVGVCISPIEGLKIVSRYFNFEAIQDKILEVDIDNIKEEQGINEEKITTKCVQEFLNDDINSYF